MTRVVKTALSPMRTRSSAIVLCLFLFCLPRCKADEHARSANEAIKKLIYSASVYDEKGMAAATKQLGKIGRSAIPPLIELLKRHEDSNVRWQAVEAVHQIGAAAPDLIDPLVQATRDRDGDVRASAIRALTSIFPNNKGTLIAAQSLSTDAQPFVRVRAHASLWTLVRNKDSISALVRLLRSKDWMVAEEASRAILHIGQPAIEILNLRLRSNVIQGRVALVRTLATIPDLPESAIDTLFVIANSTDRRLAQPAIAGLSRGGNRCWPMLIRLAESPNILQRVESLNAMGTWPNLPRRGKRLLLKRTTDGENAVVLAAIKAIGDQRIGEPEFIDALLLKLKSPSQDHRAAAIVAISRMPPPAIRDTANIEWLAMHESAEHIRQRAIELIDQFKMVKD